MKMIDLSISLIAYTILTELKVEFSETFLFTEPKFTEQRELRFKLKNQTLSIVTHITK